MRSISRVFRPARTARISPRLSILFELGLSAGLATSAWLLAGEPVPRVAFADFMQKLGYTQVQLQVLDESSITTKGKLNGAKTTFLVDTGCSISVVGKPKGNKLPRLEKGKLKLQDSVWGSLQDPDLALVEKVELGSAQFFNQPVEVFDLAMRYRQSGSFTEHPALQSGEQGRDFDAVLGGDFLLRHYAVLNVREGCLYLRGAAPSEQAAAVLAQSLRQSGLETVPLTNAYSTGFVVTLQLNGQNANFLVDTGSFVTLLDEDFARRARVPFQATSSKLVGVRGRRASLSTTHLGRLRIGPWETKDFPVGVASLKPWFSHGKRPDRPEIHGLLGPDVLARCYAVLDYHGSRMFVRKGDAGK
jgi:predicted aspartyl protease